jgi:hypothetical protein
VDQGHLGNDAARLYGSCDHDQIHASSGRRRAYLPRGFRYHSRRDQKSARLATDSDDNGPVPRTPSVSGNEPQKVFDIALPSRAWPCSDHHSSRKLSIHHIGGSSFMRTARKWPLSRRLPAFSTPPCSASTMGRVASDASRDPSYSALLIIV